MEEEYKVCKTLDELNIQYEKYYHAPAYTMEEVYELDLTIKGIHCKNLFLRNGKGDQHYLVVVKDPKVVDLKKLAKDIGSTRLSFASEERLYKYLQLKPGSVSPFGLIYDIEKHVKVIVDRDLFDHDRIGFHPNINSATVTLSFQAFERYLKWCGNDLAYIQL